jgi:HEAT repeat protein
LEFRVVVEETEVAFGEPLKIRGTLTNRSQEAVILDLERALPFQLDCECPWGGGQAMERQRWSGTAPPPRARLVPGESLEFGFVSDEATGQALGPVTLRFTYSNLFKRDGEPPTWTGSATANEVALTVRPNALMKAVRAASEPSAELTEQVVALLRQRFASPGDPVDSHRAEQLLNYLAGEALPYLKQALKSPQGEVRALAYRQLPYTVWAIAARNAHRKGDASVPPRPKIAWIMEGPVQDQKAAADEVAQLALQGLNDPDPTVRAAALAVFERAEDVEPFLEPFLQQVRDNDPTVRRTALEQLRRLMAHPSAWSAAAQSLTDPDGGVRDAALQAFTRAPEVPSVEALCAALRQAPTGAAQRRLLDALAEHREADRAPIFAGLKPEARVYALAILAGRFVVSHESGVAGNGTIVPDYQRQAEALVTSALQDPEPAVRRAAILLALRYDGAAWQERWAALRADPDEGVRRLAAAAWSEFQQRNLFPLHDRDGQPLPYLEPLALPPPKPDSTPFATPRGREDPGGYNPQISPDGQHLAFVRFVHSFMGGLGRSNMGTRVEVMPWRDGPDHERNGTIVPDYERNGTHYSFLSRWTADGAVCTFRDGRFQVWEVIPNSGDYLCFQNSDRSLFQPSHNISVYPNLV